MLNILEKRDHPYPEPTWDAKNINKKQGDTTFKICGWCEHAGGGSCRYNCHISTNCSLLPDYGIGSQTYWDTPCLVKIMGREDLKSATKGKEYDIEELKKQIVATQEELKILNMVTKSAKDSPPLPENRIYNYYNEGDKVYVFHEDKWHTGVVVLGYRHHDGCVSYVLNAYPESQAGKKGPWGCGVGVPCILKKWEYDYFSEHMSQFEMWLSFCDKEYNGEELDLEKYYKSIGRGVK